MLRQSNKIFIGDWAKIRIMVSNILVNIFHTFTDSEILNKCRQNTMINTSVLFPDDGSYTTQLYLYMIESHLPVR
jgi:hypothetical protein